MREANPKLLAQVRLQACLACYKKPCDAHHVTTRGAGGSDTVDNLMPLCHRHHMEFHNSGRSTMIRKYIGIKRWLEEHGRM